MSSRATFWDLITEQEVIDLRVPGGWVEDA